MFTGKLTTLNLVIAIGLVLPQSATAQCMTEALLIAEAPKRPAAPRVNHKQAGKRPEKKEAARQEDAPIASKDLTPTR